MSFSEQISVLNPKCSRLICIKSVHIDLLETCVAFINDVQILDLFSIIDLFGEIEPLLEGLLDVLHSLSGGGHDVLDDVFVACRVLKLAHHFFQREHEDVDLKGDYMELKL